MNHRRAHIFEAYRDNWSYRVDAVEGWVSFGGEERDVMKMVCQEDNKPGSLKIHAAERLAYLRMQEEIMLSDDKTFRAIWEPYRSGLTSNVTDLKREFRLIRETLHAG